MVLLSVLNILMKAIEVPEVVMAFACFSIDPIENEATLFDHVLYQL